MNSIKIISWNIAGGYPINFLGEFDYASENIDYFVENIKKLDPDRLTISLQTPYPKIIISLPPL